MTSDNRSLNKRIKADSPVYKFVFFLVRLVFGSEPEPEYILNDFDKVTPPYILLSNHESFNDFYYLYKLPHKGKPIYVMNRLYCNMPFLRQLNKYVGMIPKKLFYDDMVTPVRIMRNIREGNNIIIYPEARMCIDGRTNRLTESGGAFFKRLGVDIVLVRVNGAFYEKPKWRKRRYRTPVSVTVEKVIKAKQAASMSDDELNSTIVNAIRNDAGNHLLCKYPQKDKAEGLHNILYRCFSCDSLYTTTSKGNTITCSKCGKTFTLNEDYRFTEAPYTIAAWYDHMTEVELKDIDNVELSAEVSTVIYSNKGKKRKDRGSLRLTHDEVSYRSPNVSFTHKMEKLQAIVFTSGEHVELYYKDEMYYFFPDEDPIQCARWAHIVDIIKSEEEKRIKDGK